MFMLCFVAHAFGERRFCHTVQCAHRRAAAFAQNRSNERSRFTQDVNIKSETGPAGPAQHLATGANHDGTAMSQFSATGPFEDDANYETDAKMAQLNISALSFDRFAHTLYCTGMLERRCIFPDTLTNTTPGDCFWEAHQSQQWLPAPRVSMSNAIASQTHRWRPAAKLTGSHHFGAQHVRRCVSRQNWFLIGDSTVRDFFYEFLAAAGKPFYSSAAKWRPDEWQPNHPKLRSFARDSVGICNGDTHQRSVCRRQVQLPELNASFSFRFISNGGAAEWAAAYDELSKGATPTAVAVQCPLWKLSMPNAYNYSLSQEARHTLANVELDSLTRLVKQGCGRFLASVARQWPQAARYFLGLMPMKTSELKEEHIVVHHNVLGVFCHKQGDGTYTISSETGLIPIDRYNTVGNRRSDTIHPIFNAHFAVLQQILNHACRMKDAKPLSDRGGVKNRTQKVPSSSPPPSSISFASFMLGMSWQRRAAAELEALRASALSEGRES
mmetsp:Transcript_969/g.1641  ORF Transcript_969/g.1641 Transcript_969/m.1641 type:complete len:498 (+) Transcript_969:204-1697(+)